MEYDEIYLGENFTQEQIRRYLTVNTGRIGVFTHCNSICIKKEGDDSRRHQSGNQMQGVVLQIRDCQGKIRIEYMDLEYKIQLVNTKHLYITNLSFIQEAQIISLYEILWSLKMELMERTLLPVVNGAYETSIKGVYYITSQSAQESLFQ